MVKIRQITDKYIYIHKSSNHTLIDIINQFICKGLFNQSFSKPSPDPVPVNQSESVPGVCWVNALMESCLPSKPVNATEREMASLAHFQTFKVT